MIEFDKHIYYKEGDWKYQLTAEYRIDLSAFIKPLMPISESFIQLSAQGILCILNGYCWDGPSGPMIDTPTAMRGSLVHDALYQLMRMGLLPGDCRKTADIIFFNICRDDGMSWIRARYALRALRLAGGPAASTKNRKINLIAP